MAITAGLQIAVRARNASGAALALLVALGNIPPTWPSLGELVMGVFLVTVLGEAARQVVVERR